ncbi:MAG: dicarboxylate/amino acid:cation symporter [Firmicutes bacterium]|nr:dicarboxylate/amino acid:cation symporter [Bacillota bacterium]
MGLFKSKFLKVYGFPIAVLLAIIIGSLWGNMLGEDASIFKPFGDIFLNLMFTLVVPLVFFTISSSIANMIDLKRLGKIMGYSLIVFVITCIIAAVVMVLAVKIVDPVGSSNILIDNNVVTESVGIGEQIVSTLTVSDFSQILSRKNMLPMVIFSILFGIGVSCLGESGKKLSNILDSISKALMKVVKIIMYYAPIGLCAYFMNLVGTFGLSLVEGYLRSFILYTTVGIIYYLVFYSLYAFISAGKLGVKQFFKNILNPTSVALATQSSLATLPTNLDAAKEIGISKDIREVSMSVGTSMNMHGSVMGAILKIAFLFSVFGREFSGLDTYLIAILISVLSGVVMSGIPSGGLIGEMLIVSMYSFPPGAFLIISTIGIIIDAPATAINVVGNPVSAMLVSRLVEGKNWLKKKFSC